MKKKLIITSLSFAMMASIFLLVSMKAKCSYPVFEFAFENETSEGCLHTTEVIHHAHKTDTMVEVVTPHAFTKVGQKFSFQNKQELASFLCKVILSSMKKQAVRSDTIKSKPRDLALVIQDENNKLVANNSYHGEIIDRLFCMAL